MIDYQREIVVPDIRFWEMLSERLEEKDEPRHADPLAHLHWRDWLHRLFPDQVAKPMAKRHERAWDWAWEATSDAYPSESLWPWPRKGGKTSTLQLVVVATILRGTRLYWLYVCGVQEQADGKVANIARLFERDTVRAYYPHHAERAVSRYKTSLDWNKTRLRTGGGGIVDSLGLFTAARGVLVDAQPPDGIALDEIDDLNDSTAITKKKERTIKSSILPAGTDNAMLVFAQNLIIPHGVMSRLVDGKADFMLRREVIGPEKSIDGLKTERYYDEERQRYGHRIVAGTPTWVGQDIASCQARIDRFGLQAFTEECQNEVEEREGALWTKTLLNDLRVGVDELPKDDTGDVFFVRVVVGVDPSGGGDEIGIIAVGLAHNGHAYVLADVSQPGPKGPNNWARAAVNIFDDLAGDRIVAESNFGGNMVESTIRVHSPNAPVRMVSASRGKRVRAEPVVALYEEGLIHHVGSFPELETELTSWVPDESTTSPNRLDALVWAVSDLLLQNKPRTGRGIGKIRVSPR